MKELKFTEILFESNDVRSVSIIGCFIYSWLFQYRYCAKKVEILIIICHKKCWETKLNYYQNFSSVNKLHFSIYTGVASYHLFINLKKAKFLIDTLILLAKTECRM